VIYNCLTKREGLILVVKVLCISIGSALAVKIGNFCIQLFSLEGPFGACFVSKELPGTI
jgi:hypothetical protein